MNRWLRALSGSWTCALLSYVVTSVALTWPLANDIAGRTAMGTEHTTTVPHASAWALWWVSDRLAHGLQGFWDAPIFFPTQGTFAFSEPLLLQGVLVAPVMWLGGTPVLAHNLALLASLVANGLAAFGLLGHLRVAPLTRWGTGALMVALPFAHDQLGVLTLVCLAGPIASVWAALAFAERATLRRGAAWGLALATSYLCSAQMGLFTVLASTPMALVLLWRSRSWRRCAIGLSAGAVVASLCVAPVAYRQIGARDQMGLKRSNKLAATYAAQTKSFGLRTPAHRFRLGVRPAHGAEYGLFPGWLTLLLGGLAVGAAVSGRLPRRRRRALVALFVFATTAQLVSVAPHAPAPIPELWRSIPGVAQVRSHWRAAALWQVAMVLMAGMGLQTLGTALRRWGSTRWHHAMVGTLLLLGMVELFPQRQQLRASPVRRQHEALATFVTSVVPPGEPIAFLPAPVGSRARHYSVWAWWMAAQDQLDRPQVGGYSSYFPSRPYRPILTALRKFPRSDWCRQLRAVGVRYVVVRASWWKALEDAPDEVLVWSPANEAHWVAHLDPTFCE